MVNRSFFEKLDTLKDIIEQLKESKALCFSIFTFLVFIAFFPIKNGVDVYKNLLPFENTFAHFLDKLGYFDFSLLCITPLLILVGLYFFCSAIASIKS